MSPSDLPTADDAPGVPDTIQAGDLQAFERLFLAYVDPLARYVYTYVKSLEVAEELVHDVFLRLWLRLEENAEPIRSVKGYLYTAARYEALDHLRHQHVEDRHRVRAGQLALTFDTPAMAADAEQRLVAHELAAAIQRAVDDLPPRQREVIHLRWIRQFSHEEIAATLGIAVKTVAEHLRRATDHLRRTLPPSVKDPE